MKIQRGSDPDPSLTYKKYKPYLPPLFRRRCAYCLIPEDYAGGYDGMTVDHFLPRRYEALLPNGERKR